MPLRRLGGKSSCSKVVQEYNGELGSCLCIWIVSEEHSVKTVFKCLFIREISSDLTESSSFGFVDETVLK